VYSNNEKHTKIAYNDPLYLKNRHGIDKKDNILETISKALNTITSKAIEK